MDIFSIEREDNTRLAESYPRETVSLVLKVSERVHKETLKDLQKRKSECDKEIISIEKSIKDLKILACSPSSIFEFPEIDFA